MTTPERLRRAFGPSVTPLAGGRSGETFLADLDGEEVVLRLYARAPQRAVVDVALLRRLRGVVPVPAVLDARVHAEGDLPPYVLTARLPGERLDEALARVGEREARELGRAVGGVTLRLATARFDAPASSPAPTSPSRRCPRAPRRWRISPAAACTAGAWPGGPTRTAGR